MTRFELATSTPPEWRTNQAVLHLVNKIDRIGYLLGTYLIPLVQTLYCQFAAVVSLMFNYELILDNCVYPQRYFVFWHS